MDEIDVEIQGVQLGTLIQAQLLSVNSDKQRRRRFARPEMARLVVECLEITRRIHDGDSAAIQCLHEADHLLKTCDDYAQNEPLWPRVWNSPRRFFER